MVRDDGRVGCELARVSKGTREPTKVPATMSKSTSVCV